jgi:hypothetical protein
VQAHPSGDSNGGDYVKSLRSSYTGLYPRNPHTSHNLIATIEYNAKRPTRWCHVHIPVFHTVEYDPFIISQIA